MTDRLSMLLAATLLAGCAGTPPSELGVHDGALAPCPESPNCVSSRAADADHRVDPLRYEGAADQAWARAQQAVETLPRTRIVTTDDEYLHAESRSRVFGFVDDLELLLDTPAQAIQVRSAARTGYYDFGVNRERVETLRSQFQQPRSGS